MSMFFVLHVAFELFQEEEEEEKSPGLCSSDLKSVSALTELLGSGGPDNEGSCADGQGPSVHVCGLDGVLTYHSELCGPVGHQVDTLSS